MYYKYDMSNVINIQRFSNIEKMGNNTELLEIMKEAQEKAKEQIHQIIQLSKNVNNKSHVEIINKPKSNENIEGFTDPNTTTTTTTTPNLVDQDTYYAYIDKLDITQEWLNNKTAELFNKIQEKLNDYNTNRTQNKAEILDLLTNVYVINYIYKLNKDNAEVYKVYLKYNDPKKNMYYKPYLD